MLQPARSKAYRPGGRFTQRSRLGHTLCDGASAEVLQEDVEHVGFGIEVGVVLPDYIRVRQVLQNTNLRLDLQVGLALWSGLGLALTLGLDSRPL